MFYVDNLIYRRQRVLGTGPEPRRGHMGLALEGQGRVTTVSLVAGVVFGLVLGSRAPVLSFAIAHKGDCGDDDDDGNTSHGDPDEGTNR